MFDVELQTYALNAEDDVEENAEGNAGVNAGLGQTVLINNKLKQKVKHAHTPTGDNIFLNENFYSHEIIEKATLFDEQFLTETAIALKTNFDTIKNFAAARLAEMKLTGQSEKYPLGTIRRILMEDFKREGSKSHAGKNTWQHPKPEEKKEKMYGRIKESDLIAYMNRKFD